MKIVASFRQLWCYFMHRRWMYRISNGVLCMKCLNKDHKGFFPYD